MALGKARKNSVRILPKKVEIPVIGRKSSCDKSREGRAETNKKELRQEVVAEEAATGEKT